MTDCTIKALKISKVKKRKIELNFEGGNITSDGGIIAIHEADKRLSLTENLSRKLADFRRKKSCTHSFLSLLCQRIYGLILGYEDLNDHDELRHDIAFQTAVNSDKPLAGSSTLCRFENSADHETAVIMHKELLEQFIKSFKNPPKKLTLDFDGTDDQIHGNQEGAFFNGYYKGYCFLPLYVFCNKKLLVAYHQASNHGAAHRARAVLTLLVKRLQKEWPEVKILFRADSEFTKPEILEWSEKHAVDTISGLRGNSRLTKLAKDIIEKAKTEYIKIGEKQRIFGEIEYATKNTWKRKRRVIVKAEYSSKGANTRFVVTSLSGDPQKLYDEIYCARGDMENRIKEQQLYLFADRTSCHKWYANQFRLLLSAFAYNLMQTIREIGLLGTELANAQCHTIRLKILKIGAVVTRNTRRIYFKLSSAYPFKKLFHKVLQRLCPE